jgi:hypothetical protein
VLSNAQKRRIRAKLADGESVSGMQGSTNIKWLSMAYNLTSALLAAVEAVDLALCEFLPHD